MNRRKWMAWVLALVMLLGMLPAAQAATSGCPGSNDGNHSWGSWNTREATCASPGYRVRSCSACGAQESEDIPTNNNHSWGEWKTSREATCSAEGEEVRSCSVCGKRETRSIAKASHSWSKWKTVREATCARKGEETRKCSVCGKKETRETKKKAHTFGEWTIVRESTCSEKGERTRTCQKCGQVDTEAIDLLPHAYGEWTVTKAATCTAEGEQTAVCQVCGHEEIQSVPMIDHSFGEWVVIAPLTDWSIGIRERTCSMCGLVEHEETEPSGTVKKGDKGEGVKDLQTALNESGYNCGAADGIFGNKTEAAVKNVEQDNGKTPDGIGWPGVPKLLLGGKDLPELVKLTATNTNPQPYYPEAFTATFDLTLENTSDMDLEEWTLYQKYENDIGIGEWTGVAGGGFLAAGDTVTVEDLVYTIGSTDVESGWAKVSWYVSGKAAGGKSVYSNEDACELDTQQAAPTLELTADKIGVVKFADGAEVTVPMTLVNTGAVPVELTDLKNDSSGAGTVSTEAWMSQPLEPLTEYHFTLTIIIQAYEMDEDWTYRTVVAEVRDASTGATGKDGVHAFAVNKAEGPSVILVEDDLTGCGGDVDDIVGLPMYAINNGDVDLAVSELVSGHENDWADYDHAFDTLFAAGDRFPFTFNVKVLPLDAAFAATYGAGHFFRTIILRAFPTGGGEVVMAIDEPMLWFSGPLPGLKLTMTQTTPDQATWTPDGSGHIADIEYDCTVENTGERPLVLDNLLAHMYPDTEVAFVALDLGQSVVLQPGETHNFKAKLPIGAANITPGSGSETFDGIISADFAVSGLDTHSTEEIICSIYADNEFSYKVKLNEYEWTPPTEAAPGITIAVEDTTGKGGYLNDTIDLQVTVTNSGGTELKDVALDANSADGALGTTDTWTIPAEYASSFLPGDQFTFTYSVDVNGDDANYAMGHGNLFNRWLIISAQDAATGEPVNADVKFDLELWITTDGIISVHKSEESSMPGGYLINQGADCLISVTNNSDDTLYNLEVYDHENGDISGMLIDVIPTLLPHKTVDIPYTMWVTETDASKGKMTNYATVDWTDPATGETQTFTSNEIEIDTKEGVYGGVTVAKSDAGSADPKGYALNETANCDIAVTNETGQTLINVDVLDHPNGDPTGILIATIPSIANGATVHVSYPMVVTQPDVDRGYMTNKAHVDWTDPTTGELKSEESNTITMDVKGPETVYGGLEVVKSVEGGPGNGSFYVKDEPITFKVEVTNHTGQKLNCVTVYDPLCAGGMLVEYYDMADGDTKSETFTYVVTDTDVGNTEVINVANVHAEGEDGTKYIVLSNPASAPTGEIIGVIVDCAITKTETSTPDNGSFYVQGEKIKYTITVTNTGEVPLDEVIAYDTLKIEDGGELGSEMNLMPSDSRTYTFEYEVDGWDCDNGKVYNDAYAVYRLADNVPHLVFSETVESPTGFVTPGVTPNDDNPPPIGPAGDPSPEPGDPTPEPDGEPGPEIPTYCVRTLTGLGEGQRAYTLDYCAEHGAIWKSVDALVARADTDETKLAAWQQAIDLWTEAVRAEYCQLLVKARPEDIPTLMNEQALFFLQLSCHRDALASLSGEDAIAASLATAEQVMNKCADMCYERHTAPEARVDSLLAEDFAPLGEAETPERCLRDVTPTATGAAYLEALCETHAADEALERGAIGAAGDGAAKADAWKQIKGLWLAELDALTNARYLAADAAGRKVIAAERVSFGNWLKAREAVLELLYPDHPEIVGEVIADAIRGRVLSLCGEE